MRVANHRPERNAQIVSHLAPCTCALAEDKLFTVGGKRHQEIFEFKRAEKGTAFHKKEWDDLVKPLIYKWGKFVETHLVQAEKEKPKSEESD